MPIPSTDISVFDHYELVTYEPVAGDPVEIQALRRPLTQSRQRNVERYVELFATDVVFHLEGEPLLSMALAVGDSITDADSVTLQVVFVERQVLGNVVVVVCRPPGG